MQSSSKRDILWNWSTRPTHRRPIVIITFAQISVRPSIPTYKISQIYHKTSRKNNDHYWWDCGSGWGDHWWHMSCLMIIFDFDYYDHLITHAYLAVLIFVVQKIYYYRCREKLLPSLVSPILECSWGELQTESHFRKKTKKIFPLFSLWFFITYRGSLHILHRSPDVFLEIIPLQDRSHQWSTRPAHKCFFTWFWSFGTDEQKDVRTDWRTTCVEIVITIGGTVVGFVDQL